MSLLWLLAIPLANRFVGMGIVSRLISLPVASLVIGTSLCMAIKCDPWWIMAFAGLFALGRGPNIANGFHLITGEPIDPSRDGWDTRWITEIINGSVFDWAFLRIYIYYMPFFVVVAIANQVSTFYGLLAVGVYALSWCACYFYVKPLWTRMKWPVSPNCYTVAAESAECVLFAVILGILISI